MWRSIIRDGRLCTRRLRLVDSRSLKRCSRPEVYLIDSRESRKSSRRGVYLLTIAQGSEGHGEMHYLLMCKLYGRSCGHLAFVWVYVGLDMLCILSVFLYLYSRFLWENALYMWIDYFEDSTCPWSHDRSYAWSNVVVRCPQAAIQYSIVGEGTDTRTD